MCIYTSIRSIFIYEIPIYLYYSYTLHTSISLYDVSTNYTHRPFFGLSLPCVTIFVNLYFLFNQEHTFLAPKYTTTTTTTTNRQAVWVWVQHLYVHTPYIHRLNTTTVQFSVSISLPRHIFCPLPFLFNQEHIFWRQNTTTTTTEEYNIYTFIYTFIHL